MLTLEKQKPIQLGMGTHLHFIEDEKGKSTLVGVLFRQPLKRETATMTALLAQVLTAGCYGYQTKQRMLRRLEELYGSILDISVLKKGEEQILFFYLEVPNLPREADGLLTDALTFLQEVVRRPLQDENGFPDVVVNREKEILRRKLRGRMDDKAAYAKERCTEEMCKNEPFGVNADGYEEDLDQINGKTLYRFYQTLLTTAPVEILVTGKPNRAKVQARMESLFHYPREQVWGIPQAAYAKPPKSPQRIWEPMDVKQGKLCVGYRSTGADFFALLLCNEILGGSTTSRLFAKLREKEALCYSVSSFLYRFKNILMVQAGIDAQGQDQAVDFIQEAVSDMARGNVTGKEMKDAKISLLNHFHSLEDNPTGITDFYLTQYLLGKTPDMEAFCNRIEKVAKEDVIAAAKSLVPDTIYFLSERV